jgi:hypothetical protein
MGQILAQLWQSHYATGETAEAYRQSLTSARSEPTETLLDIPLGG